MKLKGPRAALVVDDEVLIAMAVAQYCREFGLAAHEAYAAADALRVLDLYLEIDVMITDVRMPVMSGPALAREALLRRPGLAVLFITGFASPDERMGFGRWPVLAKPFEPAAMHAALHQAIALR